MGKGACDSNLSPNSSKSLAVRHSFVYDPVLLKYDLFPWRYDKTVGGYDRL